MTPRGADGPLRIVLADDHALLLEAMRIILEPVGVVIATASNGDELVRHVRELKPDLVVTDLSMPTKSGFGALQEIGEMPDPPPVIVLTVHEDPGTVRTALRAGARAYVPKASASHELLAAISAVRAGRVYLPAGLRDIVNAPAMSSGGGVLTPRQREVVEALAAGLTSKQIAARLGISERTVGFHRDELRRRLGARTAGQILDLLRRLDAETSGG